MNQVLNGTQFSTVIPFKGDMVAVDVVADRWIFDSETIATGATEQQFFVTKAAKGYHQANFEGDYTLVPEGRIFIVLAAYVAFYQDDTPAYGDAKPLFTLGYYEWKIQQTITDRDWLHRLIGGEDLFDVTGTAGPFTGDGDHGNLRKYAVARIVPGGRAIEYGLFWPGGLTLTKSCKVFVSLYGYEAIPTAIV
jgi:hypothetical protein